MRTLAWQTALSVLYGSDIDNIDPWVGALSEDHLSGAAVGELIATALADQFTRLAVGDRFFYFNDPDLLHPDILAVAGDVGRTRLSQIILRNTGMNGHHPRPSIHARGGADIHRTVHNSVIVWTTSSSDHLDRRVGFGNVRRPDGIRRAPGIPR